MKLNELLEICNEIAPFELQASWDNSGMVVGSSEDEIERSYFFRFKRGNHSGMIMTIDPYPTEEGKNIKSNKKWYSYASLDFADGVDSYLTSILDNSSVKLADIRIKIDSKRESVGGSYQKRDFLDDLTYLEGKSEDEYREEIAMTIFYSELENSLNNKIHSENDFDAYMKDKEFRDIRKVMLLNDLLEPDWDKIAEYYPLAVDAIGLYITKNGYGEKLDTLCSNTYGDQDQKKSNELSEEVGLLMFEHESNYLERIEDIDAQLNLLIVSILRDDSEPCNSCDNSFTM